MLGTGLKDPRVAIWESAKLAATLRQSGDREPILLRVDEQGGHSSSTKTQADEFAPDVVTFMLWQAGKAH
jgi:protease II